MALFEGEAARAINKSNGDNFIMWKLKSEMGLASVDLWGIVDKFEATPHSNVNPKVTKEHQRHLKKAMSIITFNLLDNQLVDIKELQRTN